MERTNAAAAFYDAGAAAPVLRDREGTDSRVAVRELHDVADIGTTPLVDGLIVVVADYTKLDLAAPDGQLVSELADVLEVLKALAAAHA